MSEIKKSDGCASAALFYFKGLIDSVLQPGIDYSSMLMIGQLITIPTAPQGPPSGPVTLPASA